VPSRHRTLRPALLSTLVAGAVGLVPLVVALAPPASAAATDVRINEIITNSSTVADSIELTNVGTAPVDVSGWIVKDDNDTRTLAIATGSVVAPGGFLTVTVDGVPGGFGLGNGDAARVFLPDGTTLVDGHAFPSHSSPSWSRCPDGTGEFVQAVAETLGAANSCTTPDTAVRINEVESNQDTTDWVEIVNTGRGPVDVSGWIVRDDKDASAATVPAGTTLAAGAFLAIDTDVAVGSTNFGLGGADQARLFSEDGTTLIDSYSWSAHASTTYGRCPDGVGDFTTTLAGTKAAANSCPVPAGADALEINEVKSNPNPDFVEVRNVSDSLVDVADFWVADSTASPVRITTESTPLQPGQLFAFDPDAIPGGFGLGASDQVTILLSDRTTVVDSYSWTSHRLPSYGRCPDAEGLVENAAPSPGAENVCQPVRLNEIESSGGTPGDWIELVNVTDAPVDVSGWVLKDDDDSHAHALAAGTTIAAGGYLVVDEAALGFGLGQPDAARLFRADGTTLVDSYAWTTHATTTYGRCADGAGDLVTTRTPTKGAANDCPPPYFGVDTEPWPGSQDVTESDAPNAFVSDVSAGDVSGLAFDPTEPGVLWAIKNKNRLFKLTKVAGLWTPLSTDGWAGGKELRFANGAGEPDTEGVTVGPDGAIYATSERDNVSSSVPRNTVLRYDPAAPGPLTATHEWDLTADFPELAGIPGGSNLGFEGLTWVPDSYLVANGFLDESTGSAYRPADYAGHGTGLFFLALENDGALYAYALGGGTPHRVAKVASGFPHVMDTSFDPERQQIWAVCDDTCQGQVSVLRIGGDGRFAVQGGYDRPTGMPNLNNEGFAIAPQATCANGVKEVVWADDTGTGGHSLRSATLPCTPPVTPPAPPVVARVTAGDATVVYGRGARVTVQVAAAGVVPSGTVALTAGSVPLGSARLAANGTATVTVPPRALAPRSAPYPISVRYAGDAAVLPGSGTARLTVRKGGVRLAASVKPGKVRAKRTRATVAVRLVNADGVPVTGRVRVSGPGVKARTVAVSGGRASLRLPAFARPGTRKLVVAYAGSPLLEAKRTTVRLRVVRR
jgi:hypothetical protein